MPSIVDGLFSGRSGIQSHGTAISVLADNIANQNTTGFKAARADFVDLLAGTLGGGGGASSTGNGSSVAKITRILNQGTFESTGRGLDVGIDGNGFLVVEDSFGSRYYTRAGNLQVNPEGFLLDQNGYKVQGFPANGSGALTSLNVNQRVSEDIATETLSLAGNLDASAAVAAVPAPATFATLSAAANFQYTMTVYDSLGASHEISIYFFKSAANTWSARMYADGDDITASGTSDAFLLGTLPLGFNSSGILTTAAAAAAVATLTPSWSNGSAAGSISVSMGGFSQFASPNTIGSADQNGTGSGSVIGFGVQSDGTLIARLDNGQTSSIGVIALAAFANAEGLQRVGNSLFAESAESGDSVIGNPAVGIFGKLESGALELSTADLAADFIKLISLQRGFQGSSRIVSSINDLLNEVVNLGR